MHLNIKGCDGSPGSTGETPLCSIPLPEFQKRISGTENGSKRGIDAGFIRFARPPSGVQIGHIFRGVHFIRPPQQLSGFTTELTGITEKDVENTVSALRGMGVKRLNVFTYRLPDGGKGAIIPP